MQSAHAHISEDDDGAPDLSWRDRPIDLVDIARVLGASANVERLGDNAPIRTWRDDLGVLHESLAYARAILGADLAILSHPGSPETAEPRTFVDELPSMLTAGLPEDLGSADESDGLGLDFDEDLFIRTDHLLAAHQEMAHVDLSATAARARVLTRIEEQLAILTERQAAVEARLQQIRVVIFRRYQQGAASA